MVVKSGQSLVIGTPGPRDSSGIAGGEGSACLCLVALYLHGAFYPRPAAPHLPSAHLVTHRRNVPRGVPAVGWEVWGCYVLFLLSLFLWPGLPPLAGQTRVM